MYVIYYGKGNTLVTSLTAALHLKNYSLDQTSISHHTQHFYDFYQNERGAMGRLIYIGSDEDNNQIYILNTSSAENLILPALSSVFDILQVQQDVLYLADTTEIKSLSITIGILLYRWNILKSFASLLIFRGIKKKYTQLDRLISKVKIFTKK